MFIKHLLCARHWWTRQARSARRFFNSLYYFAGFPMNCCLGESSSLWVCCPMYYLSENAWWFQWCYLYATTHCMHYLLWLSLDKIQRGLYQGLVFQTQVILITPEAYQPGGDTVRFLCSKLSYRHRLLMTATWPKREECTRIDPFPLPYP